MVDIFLYLSDCFSLPGLCSGHEWFNTLPDLLMVPVLRVIKQVSFEAAVVALSFGATAFRPKGTFIRQSSMASKG